MTCEVSGTTPPLGGPQRRRAENLSEMYPPTTTSLDISENTTANPNVVFWESGSAEEGRDAQAQTIRAGGASRRGWVSRTPADIPSDTSDAHAP